MGSLNLLSQDTILSLAKEVALKAGHFIKEKSNETQTVNKLTASDIKIQLDVDSQKLITSEIKKKFPDHNVFGEEGGDEGEEKKGYDWIIDPIDGTLNFFYGIPHFCISIACRLEHETIVGVVYDPCRDELFFASKGQGAYLNGNKISVSSRSKLEDCILSLRSSKHETKPDLYAELFAYYVKRVKKIRLMGATALDFAYIAAGRLDVIAEGKSHLWDIAAGKLLIEEAGGTVECEETEKKFTYLISATNGHIKLNNPL